MADLEAKIPKQIEHVFDHALAPRRLLVRQQEQEIEVGPRCQRAAPVTAYGDHADPLRGRRVPGHIDVGDREIIEHADQFVLDIGQIDSTAGAVAVVHEPFLGDDTAFGDSLLEVLKDMLAHLGLIATMRVIKRCQVVTQRLCIDQFAGLEDCVSHTGPHCCARSGFTKRAQHIELPLSFKA